MAHQVLFRFEDKTEYAEAEFPCMVGEVIRVEIGDIEGEFKVVERSFSYGGNNPGGQTEVLTIKKHEAFAPDARTTASIDL